MKSTLSSSCTLIALTVITLLAACDPSMMSGADEDRGGGEPTGDARIEKSAKALDNGTFTTTLFPEVVRIKSRFSSTLSGYCTATAIADDVLITASHCIKNENDVADYVQITEADGDNADTDGMYSSYFIMSQDIHDNIYVGSTSDESFYKRDIALIKFGKGTFSKYLSFTYKTNLASGWMTQVGFGENTTKAYGTTYLQSSSSPTSSSGYGYFNMRSDPDTFGQGVIEHGDSGGPLLYQDSSGNDYVVGVLNGGGTWSNGDIWAVYPALTPAVFNHISTFMSGKSTYCVEAYQDVNYGGDAYSLCANSSITSALESQGFSDPYEMYQAWNYDNWNDRISSLKIPSNITITLFHDYSGGQGTGSSMTFVNAFSFLDNSNISSVVDYSFNDVISAFTMFSSTSPSFAMKIAKSGKCVDVAGGSTSNGGNIQQWSCASGNTNQWFSLLSTSTSNVFQIKNATSGKCINVSGGGSANGTNIQQWTCDSSNTDNLFRLEAFGGQSRFHIVHVATGKCVDLAGGSTSDGGNIQLWECLSTSNSWINDQLFSFNRYW